MATYTWIGTPGADITLPVNWSPTGNPGPGDTAVIGNGSTLNLAYGNTTRNTLELSGTTALNFTSFTLDNGSVINTSGSLANTTITTYGFFEQQGFLYADGAAGSTMTIDPVAFVSGSSTIQAAYVLQGPIIVEAGNTLNVLSDGNNSDRVYNNGAIVAAGGAAVIGARLNDINGQLMVLQSGDITIANASSPGGSHVAFTDATGTLTINSGDLLGFNSRIEGFVAGDSIVLNGVSGTFSTSFNNGVLTIKQSGTIGQLRFLGGTYSNSSFTLTSVGSNTTITTGDGALNWQGSGGGTGSIAGDWGTAGNWAGSRLPTSGDAVKLTITDLSQIVGGIITVTSAEQAASLFLDEPVATLEVTASLTLANALLQEGGDIAVSGAGVTLSASNLLQNNNNLVVSGGATLLLSGAAAPNFGNFGLAGADIESNATIDGATLDSSGGYLLLGLDAGPNVITGNSAQFTAQNGATVKAGYTGLGMIGSNNDLSITGLGTKWTDVGTSGQVGLTLFSGGMVVGGGGSNSNGPAPGGSNQLSITSGATVTETTGAWIGVGSNGTSTSIGQVTVDNASWLIGTELDVGGAAIYASTLHGGMGTLDVQDGGVVRLAAASSATTATVLVGNVAQSSGYLNVNGIGSTLDAGGGVIDVGGSNAIGTLLVNNSGRVSASGLALRTGSRVSVGSSGTIELGSAGGATANAVNVDSGATLHGAGTIAALAVDNGLIWADESGTGNALTINYAVSGTGTLELSAGATMVLQTNISVTPTIDFGLNSGAVTETLELFSAHAVTGTIEHFYGKDTMKLDGFASTSSLNYIGGTLYVDGGGSPVAALTIAGPHGLGFTLTADTSNPANSYLTALDVACFAAGTDIATPMGETPVETLRPGDLITLAQGGTATIAWIGWREIDAGHTRAQPVRIAAGCFGKGLPRRDLRLSPDHAVHVDGVLIPARALLGCPGISQMCNQTVTYFHILLDHHDILLAEGLPCETLLEIDEPALFANAETAPPSLAFLTPCAPRIKQGARLEDVRCRLNRSLHTELLIPAHACM